MGSKDCQTRVKKEVKKRMDKLDFVERKTTDSQIVETLIDFYENHKGCKNGRKTK
jgi:hypothetical protein